MSRAAGRRGLLVGLPVVVAVGVLVLVGRAAPATGGELAGTSSTASPSSAPSSSAPSSSASSSAASSSASGGDGAQLYATSCAVCHGDDASGTDLGPSLLAEGPAAVDWVLRTGRMPLPAPGQQAVPRSPAPFDRAQIDAVIAHLQGLGMEGPAIPSVDPSTGDPARGGALFRENCAACHQVMAQGGVVNGGHEAPSLQGVDATTIGEVLAVGPGVMPSFASFDDQEVADLAAYVLGVAQRPDDAGGLGIGHLGPVPEGFVAGLVLATVVFATLRWIGRRTRA